MAGDFLDDDYYSESVDSSGGTVVETIPANDDITGTNSLPTVSTDMQNSNDSAFSGFLNKLGSIGTTATQLGTAVGTAQHNVKVAQSNFNTARTAAATGNTPATFWLYATPVEKAMIVLAVVAIFVTASK